jgi:hypothetical protein
MNDGLTIDEYGSKGWYLNDKPHRTDGPAIECTDGTKRWYHNGELHRTDGPAIECTDGTKYWYNNGELNRTDGPAIEYPNGDDEWYIDCVKLSEEEYLHRTRNNKLKELGI